ncbi:MAG: dihydropyrimidinase [Hyphomicrobiales bacterium]|nr:dihydropyrimidinase [Hyphomicrobiales bacterium]
MAEFDLVVRNGTVATAADTVRADIGVIDGRVVVLGRDLPVGTREVDAGGLLVLPGGVDTHVHVEQNGSPKGAETFASASLSAAFGGTTTMITHARQGPGESLRQCVEDYALRARASVIDYAFHLLVTDVTPTLLDDDLPALVAAGHTSVKVFMATRSNALSDPDLLALMARCRDAGALIVVHAENHAAMEFLTETLQRAGHTALPYNVLAKPAAIEREAIHRILTYAELLGMPVHVFHVTSADAATEIERAQQRGVAASGETCPQYLVFTEDDLRGNGEHAANLIFGPPPRTSHDRDLLWSYLKRGVIDVISSDHSPHPLAGPGGKLAGAREGGFPTTPHGIPGLETRMPLLFSTGVATGKLTLNNFVALTATNPAKRFGLYPAKGTIAVGSDADIVVWDPDHARIIRNDQLHHQVDYTPYEGFEVRGWPRTVISRGEVIIEGGMPGARANRGKWLRREAQPAATPLAEFLTNGAELA